MNIKLGQAEIFDTGPLRRDYIFSMEGFYSLKKVPKVSLNGWVTYLSKDGMLKRSWRFLTFQDLGLINTDKTSGNSVGSCLKSDPPQWKNSEGTPFTNPIKCKVVRGTLVHLNSFVIAIFLVTDLRFGDVAAQFGYIKYNGFNWARR